jgi:hypothetical protein
VGAMKKPFSWRLERRGFTREVTGREPWRTAAQTLLDEVEGEWVRTRYARAERGGKRIAAPEPRRPVSFEIFAHEVGHAALHRDGRRPCWQEEIEAIEFSFAAFERFGLPGLDKVRERRAPHLEAYHAERDRLEGSEPDAILAHVDALPPDEPLPF